MQTPEGGRKHRANMILKFGSEEAYREEMRKRASLSKRNTGKKGGWASMDKEDHLAASRKGGKAERRTKQLD